MILLTHGSSFAVEGPSRPVTSFSFWVLLLRSRYLRIWKRIGKEWFLLVFGENLHYFYSLTQFPCVALYCPVLHEEGYYNLFLLATCLWFLCLPSFTWIVFNTTQKVLPSRSDENIIAFWRTLYSISSTRCAVASFSSLLVQLGSRNIHGVLFNTEEVN